MKRSFALAVAVVSALLLTVADADAASRMGGGRSLGAQRSIAPPAARAPAPAATAPAAPGAAANPVMPAQPGVAAARPAAPAAAPATGASRWLGPIAGIAAGLGLAALFSHFGLSEGFGSILLILLVVGGGLLLVRALMARRAAPSASPLRYSAAPAAGTPPVTPATSQFEPAWQAGASAAPTATRRFPPGFEPAPFLAEAKRQFVQLQKAYDRGDTTALAEVLTPEMQAEIAKEIAGRTEQGATEVVSLNGDVLEVATEGGQHWASVRFTGLTRDAGATNPEPFDEVWNLVKPVNGSAGWRLAGIQQYA
jgi:predicted lipid-binding transport protein (Tim44 family)